MTSTNFIQIHEFTEKWEGDYVNNPKDPGGATKYGISLRWLKAQGIDIDNDGDINIEDIKKLTKPKVLDLFYNHFWLKAKCDLLPKPLAAVLYDASVNLGLSRGIKILQQACNIVGEAELEHFTAIAEDGKLGKKTLEMIEAIEIYDLVPETAYCAIRERERFYRNLANTRVDLKTFLIGWLNRANDLRRFIGEMLKD